MNTHTLIEIATDNTFDEIIKSEKLVLVDFWAPWCKPCEALGPILEEIAKSYQERVRIIKINVDENKETPKKYSVRGIPTLILFKHGAFKGQKVGLLSKSQLTEFLDDEL